MKVRENYNIKNKHTFGIDAKVYKWIEFDKIDELTKYIKENPLKGMQHIIIGFGSNLLFTKDYEGTIIKPNFKHIELVKHKKQEVILKVGAGVIWDDFVQYCVDKKYWGAENLSFIPGCVGASPVQNVGAYGTEAKDIIHQVIAINKSTAKIRIFNNADCQYSYRNSYFKQSQEWIISEVYFRLSTESNPNITYKPLNDIFKKEKNIEVKAIREVVIKTRESKLPNPKKIGSGGSFFKNPIVDKTKLNTLLKTYPKMPFYPFQNTYKLAAGWLIDQLNWKGKKVGGAAVHENQALVLINKDNATGQDVLTLAQKIQDDVKLHFDINLEPEVIIL